MDYFLLALFLFLLSLQNAERVIFGVVTVYVLVYFVSIYIDYYTHVREEKSRNVGIQFSNICHDAIYNKLFWNFGFHVGHHSYPQAHWTELPEIEKQMGVVQSDQNVFSALNIFGLFRPKFNRWRVPKVRKKEQGMTGQDHGDYIEQPNQEFDRGATKC